ncbi:hypothetical protein C7T35_10500 [Variovorax sp. WS11]|uniref:hypothetical protein n=1 Tax=Variovorax sp. WS11 TaxID=1105204 RepID=UPI000D0D0AFE|nr:hypothetical protein [Variovorax sp. WS11]NDZ12783.1 hypothetical protein [Variovorax sp. WS11]PSL84716.1 hypothetical protein C7T35_10500 [Variovorax sp. WS11]
MTLSIDSSGPQNEPVRLIGIGSKAATFIQQLCGNAPDPLAPLLVDHSAWMEADGRPGGVDFTSVVFLFVVIGADATKKEVGDAALLAWRAHLNAVSTIGVFLVGEGESGTLARPTRVSNSARESEEALRQLVDGCIDLEPSQVTDGLESLRWLCTTLRGLAREGVLILEPAWDLNDVLEVLDLPGAALSLATRTVGEGLPISLAVAQALDDLEDSGIELESANGILLVLWQSTKWRLTVQEVQRASRCAASALGQGGLHLVLTARAGKLWEGVGACATVVVSRQRSFPKLERPI